MEKEKTEFNPNGKGFKLFDSDMQAQTVIGIVIILTGLFMLTAGSSFKHEDKKCTE